jgi:ubiquinone/menaquinone biosynthesis C-methylase UbiE
MYTHLAHLYDWPGTADLSDSLVIQLTERLEALGITPASGPMLDIACGTGEVALAMAQLGWQVWGVDQSDGMLAQARAKAAHLPEVAPQATPPQWLLGDMTALQTVANLPQNAFAVATCLSDSVNHLLTPQAVQALFAGATQVLKPGGLLALDANTHQAFVELWEGQDVTEGPNYRLVVDASFNAQSGRAVAEFLAEEHGELDDGDPTYKETRDQVQEQFYDNAQLTAWLAQAGFEAIHAEPFTPLAILEAEVPLKTWLWCRKPA